MPRSPIARDAGVRHGGSSGATSGTDFLTIAYNTAATGATLRVKRYNSPANDNDNGQASPIAADLHGWQ